jgi:uncharacterized protein YihD (DUF1040 family)
MRDPNRIPRLLQKLEIYWKQNPNLRLGQLVEIIHHHSDTKADVFYVEDDELEHGLEKLLDQNR